MRKPVPYVFFPWMHARTANQITAEFADGRKFMFSCPHDGDVGILVMGPKDWRPARTWPEGFTSWTGVRAGEEVTLGRCEPLHYTVSRPLFHLGPGSAVMGHLRNASPLHCALVERRRIRTLW